MYIYTILRSFLTLHFNFQHPGGAEIMFEHAGSDATIPFESKGHSADAYAMLEKYCIGELVEVGDTLHV